MAALVDDSGRGSLATLQQFARKRRRRDEACELCAAALAEQHQHLLDLENGRILCACDPCAILFVDESRRRYRRVPRDVRRIDFFMGDAEWDSLLIPIKLAFFVYVSKARRTVAYYPSPGGAMESSLDLEYWDAIAVRNPVLKRFVPDVEALLVNRLSDSVRYYRAPIDHCYRLIGTIRTHWRGFSGGPEVWQRIEEFFRQLDEASGVGCA